MPTTPHTLTPFRIAEDAAAYCYRKDAGRAKRLTSEASALHRAGRDDPAVWAQAAVEWRAIGMGTAADACEALADVPQTFKQAAE